jgi:hypothetical protein
LPHRPALRNALASGNQLNFFFHDEDSGILVIVLPVIKIVVVENHAVVNNVFFRLKIGRINTDNVAAAQR